VIATRNSFPDSEIPSLPGRGCLTRSASEWQTSARIFQLSRTTNQGKPTSKDNSHISWASYLLRLRQPRAGECVTESMLPSCLRFYLGQECAKPNRVALDTW